MLPIYEAVAGLPIILPCNVAIPTQREAISLILWYKESAQSPIYTLDFRKGPPENAKHFPGQAFTGRTTFDVDHRPPILKIDPVQEQDRGVYRCRIEYKRSRTLTRTVKLKVIVPPKAVVIMDDRGQRLQGIAGPYNEGKQLSLICESEGGDPFPNVTWWRAKALIDDTFRESSRGSVRNTLQIMELRRSDLMVEFLCEASNTDRVSPVNESIRVDLNLKPLYVRITTPQQPLKVGEDVRLDCESSGSRPPAKITWWKQSRKISGEKDTVLTGRSSTYSSVTLRPTKEDHGTTVSCRAENLAFPNSPLEDVWYLDVLYPPEVSLNLGANIKYSTIKEGNDVYLECHIRANPPVNELKWYFEGQQFFGNPKAGIVVSNQSLVLQKVKKEHRGRYSCSAANTEGKARSLDLLLEVRYTPVCKKNKKTVYGVSRGEVVNISCEVDADPPEVTFRWTLDNSLDQLQLKNFTTNGSFSTVTFTPQSALEYGSVQCWARNSVGEQVEPCTTRVIAAGPPDPVKNCYVSNQTQHWLLVECEAGYDGGLKQRFHLDVYNSAVEHLQVNLTAAEIPHFYVSNLPAGTQFVLVIYASNEKGKSNSVALVGSTLSYALPSKDAEAFSPISAWLIVLLVFLGMLLCIGAIFLFLMRAQKKKRRPLKAVKKESDKFEEVLKKTAEEFIENSIACPDVVPPNTGYDSSSEELAKKKSQASESSKQQPYQTSDKDLKPSNETENSHLQKVEVEVILPNINNPSAPITKIVTSSSTSKLNAQKVKNMGESNKEDGITKADSKTMLAV